MLFDPEQVEISTIRLLAKVPTIAAYAQVGGGGLTEIERYWFETQGWVVIPGVLSPQQVQACNDAIDQNRDLVNYTPLSEDGRHWVVPPSLWVLSLRALNAASGTACHCT